MNTHELEIVKLVANRLAKKDYIDRLYEVGDLYTAGWQAVQEFHNKFKDNDSDALLKSIVRCRMIDHLKIIQKKRVDPVIVESVDSSQVNERLENEKFEDMIKVLTPREQNMVRWHINDGLNYREISEIMGVVDSRICQIFKHDIFPKLKKSISR